VSENIAELPTALLRNDFEGRKTRTELCAASHGNYFEEDKYVDKIIVLLQSLFKKESHHLIAAPLSLINA